MKAWGSCKIVGTVCALWGFFDENLGIWVGGDGHADGRVATRRGLHGGGYIARGRDTSTSSMKQQVWFHLSHEVQ